MSQTLHGDRIIDGTIRRVKLHADALASDGTALPSQTGQNGKALLTDGTNPYWGTVSTQTNTGGGLTNGSIFNVHFSADVAVGSIEVGNTALGTNASSVVGLVLALNNKLLGGAPANYQTFGQIKSRLDEVSAQATTGIAANSVTNSLLGPDVKVGSLATTVAEFPTNDRAGLTDVGAMIRYIWNKVKFINQAVLEFQFEVDYVKTRRVLIGVNQAGTFTTVNTSNVTSYTVKRVSNNQIIGFPHTLIAGEYYEVSVVPEMFNIPAALTMQP